VALKLLVIYRPDGDPGKRIRMVEEFLDRCHSAGLISLIEPVSRKPADGRAWDWDEGVIAAAKELGSLGVDLYKAEVPLRGQGDEDKIRRRCSTLTKLISSPWVVLSSGVPHDLFPKAVELACREGASGFLAGRAVWASVIGSDDIERDLREISVPRLQRLCEVVDAAVRR
jgi:sulfofructosephosphate aldolase